MAIPKRVAKAKTALAIQEETECEMALGKSNNMVEVKMISIPENLLKTKEEFKYKMRYEDNLNHAFKDGVKEKIITIIIEHNPGLEVEEITFLAQGCKIIPQNENNREYKKVTEKGEWEMFPNTCVFSRQ